jgi:predicted RNA binding protein YcfA (HicA-like mRNA interferase family)
VSRRLPALKPKEVLRVLESAGFYVHHTSGSHYVLKNPKDVRLRVTLPWHNKALKRGTLGSIVKQAGLSAEQFLELL